MPLQKKPDPITTDIATTLGKRDREPMMLWYVSPERAKQVSVDLLGGLTSAPKLICEVLRTPRGGILVVIEQSVLDHEGLTDVIAEAALHDWVEVGVLIQGKDGG